MMNKSLKITTATLFVANCLVIGSLYFVWDQIKAKNENISTMQNDIATAESRQAQLNSIKSLVINTQSDVNTLQSYILPNDKEVDFIQTVESLSRMTNASSTNDFLGIEANPSSKMNTEFFIMRLESKGSWQSQYRFLSLLESLPYGMAVDSYEIKKEDSATAKGAKSWHSTISLRVLKFKAQ